MITDSSLLSHSQLARQVQLDICHIGLPIALHMRHLTAIFSPDFGVVASKGGIKGLMRGKATLLQGNQELLVVRDKVGRPQVSLR